MSSYQSASRPLHPRVEGSRLLAYRAALEAALVSAFGDRACRRGHAQLWVQRRVASFAKLGDGFLIGFRKHLTKANSEVLSGRPSRQTLGHVLPRGYSSCRNTRVLLQYLKLRRSLPPLAHRPYVDAKIDSYVESVTAEGPPRPVPSAIKRKFSALYAEYRLDSLEVVPSDLVGGAAARGFPRAEGGRSAYVQTLGLDTPTPGGFTVGDAMGGSSVDRRSLRFVESMVERRVRPVLKDALQDDSALEVEPTAIKEYGTKLRIVTKSDPRLVALAHVARRKLFPILEKSRFTVTSEPLKDPELSLITFNAPLKESVVVSADLTAATDLLSREVLDLASQVLNVPGVLLGQGARVRGLPVRRGTFMGMPLSWTVLSMIHYTVCVVCDPAHNFRIKGDDLIALWPLEIFERYRRLAASVGLVVNDKTAVSQKWGTFCEGDYLRIGNKLLRLPTFSLRPFASGEGLDFKDYVELEARGVPLSKLRRMCRKFLPRHVEAAKRLGVPLHGPKVLGCAGFPPSNLDRPIDDLSARILRELHNGKGSPLYDSDLNRRRGPLVTEAYRMLKSIRYRADEPPENKEKLDSLIQPVISRFALADAISGRLVVSKETPLFREMRGRARFRERAYRDAPWGAPPTTYRKVMEVIGRLSPILIKEHHFDGIPSLSFWARDRLKPVLAPRPMGRTPRRAAFGLRINLNPSGTRPA